MPKCICVLVLFLLCFACLGAQEAEAAQPSVEDLQLQIQAMSDSLLQLREQEIFSEFGFRDTDRLQDVAAKLEIVNLAQWKNYLGLEPANAVLDRMSLRRLGITPYRALLAQQYSIHGFTELSTLAELAAQRSLPLKKIRAFAGRDPNSKIHDSYSLQALGRKPADFEKFEQIFAANRIRYGFSILAFGVLIVFFALAVTALIIGQLRHLNRKPKADSRAIILDSQGRVKSQPPDLNSDVIAAAIATLHLYRQGIEERRRLLLTFRRARSDQWHGSTALNMPNRDILRKRSGS